MLNYTKIIEINSKKILPKSNVCNIRTRETPFTILIYFVIVYKMTTI